MYQTSDLRSDFDRHAVLRAVDVAEAHPVAAPVLADVGDDVVGKRQRIAASGEGEPRRPGCGNIAMSGGAPPATSVPICASKSPETRVDDRASRSLRRRRRAPPASPPASASDVSTPITVTVGAGEVGAFDAAVGAAAGSGPGATAFGRLAAGRCSVPAASVPAGSVPAAAVSSGVVVSVLALATLAAPSTPTIASGTNSDLTRERERMCSPLSPATFWPPILTVVVEPERSGSATMPDLGRWVKRNRRAVSDATPPRSCAGRLATARTGRDRASPSPAPVRWRRGWPTPP